MKCPSCDIEMKISSNKIVKKQDGTLAYKMELKCRNKKCPNHGEVVRTIYHPITVSDDEE